MASNDEILAKLPGAIEKLAIAIWPAVEKLAAARDAL